MSIDTACISIILDEDDDGHATLIEKNLQRAGLGTPLIRFKEGAAALEHLRAAQKNSEKRSVILIADIKMPGMDGVELLRTIRDDAALAATPIIMLTTTDDSREIARCYELGCNIYITKPIKYDEFMEAVQRLGKFLQVIELPAQSV